jgi:hypothetical protein
MRVECCGGGFEQTRFGDFDLGARAGTGIDLTKLRYASEFLIGEFGDQSIVCVRQRFRTGRGGGQRNLQRR